MPNKEDVKVGDEVCVNAPWSRISGGVVTDITSIGFQVSGMWFGWHELESVKPRAEELREEVYRRLLVRALPFVQSCGADSHLAAEIQAALLGGS